MNPTKKPIDNLEDLATRARSGDSAAMKQLVTELKDDVYRFLVYLCKDPDVASDLTQETFIRALTKITKLKDPKSCKSWILSVAKNLFLDQQRTQRSNEMVPLEDAVHLAAVEESTDTELKLEMLREALSHLDPSDRIVIVCVDLEGQSYADAAVVVGVSENALRSRLHRARQRLLSAYEKVETKSSLTRRLYGT